MTSPQITPSHVRFGQTLAFAERTLTELLHRHLAERQVAPGTWYALKLITMRESGVTSEALVGVLAGSPTMNADAAREAVTRLVADGLIRGDTRVELTAEGETYFRDLRDYVLRPTVRLLSQFPADDVETTVRTLRAITERAASEG